MAFPQPMTGLAILRYVDPWTIPSGRLPTTHDWSDAAGPKALCEDMNEALFTPKEARNVPRDVSETRVLSSVFGRFVKPGGESFLGFVSFTISWSSNLTLQGFNNITFVNKIYKPILREVAEGRRLNDSLYASATFDEAGG